MCVYFIFDATCGTCEISGFLISVVVNEASVLFTKSHFLCHVHRMGVSQMSINFHPQRAAILVTKPAGNCGNIHTALDAPRREQVSQIVMGQMMNTHLLHRLVHRLLTLADAHDTGPSQTLSDVPSAAAATIVARRRSSAIV